MLPSSPLLSPPRSSFVSSSFPQKKEQLSNLDGKTLVTLLTLGGVRARLREWGTDVPENRIMVELLPGCHFYLMLSNLKSVALLKQPGIYDETECKFSIKKIMITFYIILPHIKIEKRETGGNLLRLISKHWQKSYGEGA